MVDSGVTLVIEELLAISTDQKSKDKIYFYVMFGLDFWKELINLRHTFFVNTMMQSRNRLRYGGLYGVIRTVRWNLQNICYVYLVHNGKYIETPA